MGVGDYIFDIGLDSSLNRPKTKTGKEEKR